MSEENTELVLVNKWWWNYERLAFFGVFGLALVGVLDAVPIVFGTTGNIGWFLNYGKFFGSWIGMGFLFASCIVFYTQLIGPPVYRRVVNWRKQK